MEMIIQFPGGMRVDAHVDGFTIATDQPPHAASATPFTHFLASIGTCAGIYILSFCRQRRLPTDGLRLVQRIEHAPDGMVERVEITVELPNGFPAKYHDAIVRVANQCTVKRHLARPPLVDVTIAVPAAAGV